MAEESFISLNKILTDVQNHISKLRSARIDVKKESIKGLISQLRKFMTDNPLEAQPDYAEFSVPEKPLPQQLPRTNTRSDRPVVMPSVVGKGMNYERQRELANLCAQSIIPVECIGRPLRERELIDKKTKGFMVKKERTCSICRVTGWFEFDFLAFIVKKGNNIIMNIPLTEWKCEARESYLVFNYNNFDYEFEDKTPIYAKDWVDFANKNKQPDPSPVSSKPPNVPAFVQKELAHNLINNRTLNKKPESPPCVPRNRKPQPPKKSEDLYNDIENVSVQGSAVNDEHDHEYNDIVTLTRDKQREDLEQHERPQSEYLNDNLVKDHEYNDIVTLTRDMQHERPQSEYLNDNLVKDHNENEMYLTVPKYCVSLYDTTDVSDDNILKVKPGNCIAVKHRISNEYFAGKCGDQTGMFPYKCGKDVYKEYSEIQLYENEK